MVPWAMFEAYVNKFLDSGSVEDLFKFLVKTMMRMNQHIARLDPVPKRRVAHLMNKFSDEWGKLKCVPTGDGHDSGPKQE